MSTHAEEILLAFFFCPATLSLTYESQISILYGEMIQQSI
ncbi:hypothetical protein LEMLEM_LOCUS1355 [Lemmus lemmus]